MITEKMQEPEMMSPKDKRKMDRVLKELQGLQRNHFGKVYQFWIESRWTGAIAVTIFKNSSLPQLFYFFEFFDKAKIKSIMDELKNYLNE